MTCREKLKREHPESVSDLLWGGCMGCPDDYGYLEKPKVCSMTQMVKDDDEVCQKCWNREIPNDEPVPNAQFDIHALIDDAMQKRDRLIAIYIHPENGMSVNVYPWPDMDDLRELYEDGRITANEFRAKMNLPMVKNAEKFMKRSQEE